MIRKEMIAMLLAGGQESHLGVITETIVKPAVTFGGKYRIIDFPLSNCINSGIDTVGVITEDKQIGLTSYIGIGIPWDLDRSAGGVTVLQTFNRASDTYATTGPANAVYQNLDFIEMYDPEYVLIIPGDQVYKMDYEIMLDFHKALNAEVTIAAAPFAKGEKKYGAMTTDLYGIVEKYSYDPDEIEGTMADLGVYIFNGKVLKAALRELGEKKNLDFGKDIIPYCLAEGRCISAYEFSGYWKEVGSIEQYRKANMDLIETNPDLNLYEGFWKIYTRGEHTAPVCISGQGSIEKSIVGEGSEINGKVQNSVIGPGVIISEGACVRDSIIMQESFIGKEALIDKTVVAEGVCIGDHVVIGTGEYADNVYDPVLYNAETSVIGAGARIPAGVIIGKNAAVTGRTDLSDYPDGKLQSGHVILAGHREKEGDKA